MTDRRRSTSSAPADTDKTLDHALVSYGAASARSILGAATSLMGADERVPLFPTEPDVPRRRRPYDIARLAVTATAFLLLGWFSSTEPDLDRRVATLFSSLPDWIRTLSWFGFSVSGVGALLLVVASAGASGSRRSLFRDLLVGVGLATLVALVGGRLATGAWPNVLPEFVALGERAAYPTLRPTLVLIVASVLGPHVNAQMQRAMRWMVVATTTTPLFLGLTTLTGMLGAVSLGMLVVAGVRLAFGSPEGLPSLTRLRSILANLGIDVDEVSYGAEQPGTVGIATARTADGRALDLKIYSVDASSQQRAERVWRALWYRRSGPSPRAGRAEQAQHEALATLTARDAGADVPALIGVAQDTNGDVLLLSVAADGASLDELDDLTDDELAANWRALIDLHQTARMTHGSITPETVRRHAAGTQFTDLANASLFATPQQVANDVVAMLVTHTLTVGPARAVGAAIDNVDADVLVAALPYCQEPAIEPVLRRRLEPAEVDVGDLGSALADHLDVEVPEPASVRRVSWSDVVISLAAVLAANALISQIADVGFDTIVDEVRDASIGWLVVAFLINIASSTTAYIGLSAVVGRPLPWSPTALLQLAKRFVGLVVPTMVGRVGMDIRFLQKQGVPVAVASTQGPVIGFIGFITEVTLLALSAWSIGQTIETDELGDFDAGGLLAIAIVVVVVGIAVVFALRGFREKLLPFLRDALATVRSIITSPSTLSRIAASEALDRLLGAVALGATVAAFGADLPFASLVFVSVGTGLLAGLAPVPGGIGVAEATMTGLLTASGLPPDQAVSIAIVHRVATSYLPPVVGFFSFNWLKQEGYL